MVDRAFDPRGRKQCEAVRMNPAVFGSLPPSACTLGTTGAQGPDRITYNTYDDDNELLNVQKAHGTTLRQTYATYSWSANGKETSVTDANGNLAQLNYDGFDRISSWVFPSKTTPGQVNSADFEQYGYDAAGNRTSLRKRDGRTITYNYDNLNRVSSKLEPSGTRGVYYAYDIRGLQLTARFDSATGADGITNAYDGFGRLTSSTTSIGGLGGTISSQYDADGNRTHIGHPDGTCFDAVYDAADRLQYMNHAAACAGPVRILTFLYDPLGRPTTMNPASSDIYYQYDAVSRLHAETQHFAGSVGDGADTLGYNPASQIVSEARSNDAFVYAGATAVVRPYSVNGLNQYTAAGGATLTYDADGDLTSDGSTTYGYDAENRLISASGAKTATLTYDPLGRLWSTRGAQSSSTTLFLHDGDEIAVELNGSGALLRQYMWGPGIDQPIVWEEGPTYTCGSPGAAALFVLHADHEGSVIARADCWGNQIGINAYDEHGVPAAANAGRFGYTGQAWIPELGLWYYKARVYSPTLGRFMQTDPVGYKDQVNLYEYVGNDPVNHADPTGLDTVVELQAYPLEGVLGALGYQHQYIFLRDTETGETAISRAGPSAPYSGGVSGAASDAPAQNPAGRAITIVTQLRPAAQSIDSDPKTGRPLGTTVPGSPTTLKEPIGRAEAMLQKFNNGVDAAKIPYQPQSNNSNAYAGTGYKGLTGRTPPSSGARPGSNVDLTNKLGDCRGTRIGNSGSGSIC